MATSTLSLRQWAITINCQYDDAIANAKTKWVIREKDVTNTENSRNTMSTVDTDTAQRS